MDASWADLIGQVSGAVGHAADAVQKVAGAAEKVATVLVAGWGWLHIK